MASDTCALTKNQRRRLKKKLEKQSAAAADASGDNHATASTNGAVQQNGEHDDTPTDVAVEYVSLDVKKELALPATDPAYDEFLRIFNTFASAEELCGQSSPAAAANASNDSDTPTTKATSKSLSDPTDDPTHSDTSDNDDDDDDDATVSKKQRKKLKRLSVAELKQLVAFPDVVEAHDVTAADPRLLVFLKSYRNTVAVPRHWCHKRKYLQGKRGIEKPAFELPAFIAQTGISDVRGAAAADDDKKRAKAKARERVQPKIGRIDIDYQVLHDAFFRFQTKPALSGIGDLYYEGKEFEVVRTAKVPGQLSVELKRALGMVDGVPPPWLLNMQRYGPPPAYPNLKIPGLNAPIPAGASFGYHPGGWGKPPVDERGVPLYGDVFGRPSTDDQATAPIDRTRWGELVEVEAVENDDDDDENDDDENDDENDDDDENDADLALHDRLDATGTATPLADGISSVASGLSTPGGMVDMRKGVIRGMETPDTAPPPQQQLYTVLEQKETSVGASLYGSGHEYVVPTGATADSSSSSSGGGQSEPTTGGRVRRRFEDAPSSEDASGAASGSAATAGDGATSVGASVDDNDDAARKKKKQKAEKSKKHKDFKF